jgi:hypothetical protein
MGPENRTVPGGPNHEAGFPTALRRCSCIAALAIARDAYPRVVNSFSCAAPVYFRCRTSMEIIMQSGRRWCTNDFTTPGASGAMQV